ncbi:uncharacterized protein HGUI_00957 [Hanseniaspora guilliermondii]|uniref:Uncharacterized protein n=1 Tax=Hanseniaspora guilliermondii TaxID=56406 RepID=A0A1L0CJ13_9ASCO|nr:uncharacterized protein HGUI_00957 [Hanseniaspora guilliermondii]
MKTEGENKSLSSDSNSSSSFSFNSTNHTICYLHNNSDVICIKCLKKLVLDKRINCNVINGIINENKRILNEILAESLFYEQDTLSKAIGEEYHEEIRILRTQAILLKKNKETKTNNDLKEELKKINKENDKKRKEIDFLMKKKQLNASPGIDFSLNKDINDTKRYTFYKKDMKVLEAKLLHELVYFIDLRKNKHNNYFYICNNKLPLPRLIHKIVKVNDNSSLYNKRLYLLIEHLINFIESGYKIFYRNSQEYDLLKMALNTAFSDEMIELRKDKLSIVVAKKLTLILTLLQMIYMKRHDGKVTELLVDIEETDSLAKLIRISLIETNVQNFGNRETLQVKRINMPSDIINYYKHKLLELLQK